MKKLIQLAVVLSTMLSAMSVSAVMPSAPTITHASGGMTDQIIVKIREDAASQDPQTQLWSALTGEAMKHVRKFGPNGHVMKLRGFLPLARTQAIAARLAEDPDIEYAEADQMMQPTLELEPSASEYFEQWGFFAPSTGLMGANLPGAWGETIGSPDVNIAVIDTGIRPHADLAERYIGGYDLISTLAVANDNDGRDSNPSDPGDWTKAGECGFGSTARNSSWHGTHVAGTIAAYSDNVSSVAGINWVSKVVPVRVLGKCGGYTSDIVDGMRWAAGLPVSDPDVPANEHPAKVMNLSLGGSGACSSTYQNAVNDINAAGAVVVVAAGNSNADASGFSPASCAGVVTVAATGKAGNRSYYSNYGSAVEIAAPGGDSKADGPQGTILSTLNSGTTIPDKDALAYYQGTSMASPHVSGIVSLMFSVNPKLTPAQVMQILQGTATPFPLGSTCTTSLCGAGIVNAAGAVMQAKTPPPGSFSKSSPANGATNLIQPLTLIWSASDEAISYEVCFDNINDSVCSSPSGWMDVGNLTRISVSNLARKTTYYWQVRSKNINGSTEANSKTWWRFSTR